MTDILDAKGKVVNGALSFYHLPGGIVLFSEDVEETGKEYIFDMRCSAVVQIMQDVKGRVSFGCIRASEYAPFVEASEYRIDKSAVGRMNSGNQALYENCRKTCSLIQLAK